MIRPALPLLLLLSACGPLVQVGGNAPRPHALYTVTAKPPAAVPVGKVPIDMAKAVTVDIPALPGALQTLRIPVVTSDTSIQYVQEAQWSEQPNRLFQRVLADTLAAGGLPVIDQRSSGQIGGNRLTGQLLAFGADVSGEPVVRVRYDATLSSQSGVRQRRFEREAPVSPINGATVTQGLNLLANQIAADVTHWVQNSDAIAG